MLSSRDALATELPAVETVASAEHTKAAYYPGFDWLRITLSSAVMVAHTELVPWDRLGDFAVQIFFALSGWLIGNILLKTPASALPRFYFQRVVRIWIPYALALALLLGVSLMRDPVTPKWLEFVFYKLTFVYNQFGVPQLGSARLEMPLQGTGNHFWSICTEEQFYLIAPLILVVLAPRIGRSMWLWLALVLTGVAGFGSICVGVLAALAHSRFGDWHLSSSGRFGLVGIALASSLAALAGIVPYPHAIPWIAGSIVLLMAFPGTKQRVGGFLGGVSYPLYLNHWIGLIIANSIAKRLDLHQGFALLWLGLPLGFVISTGLYLLVDKQVLAHRDRWYTPSLGRAAMIAAYATMAIGLVGAGWIASRG